MEKLLLLSHLSPLRACKGDSDVQCRVRHEQQLLPWLRGSCEFLLSGKSQSRYRSRAKVSRFDPTVLDEHDLQECKWPFIVHSVLVAVAGEGLLTRFYSASCYLTRFYHQVL